MKKKKYYNFENSFALFNSFKNICRRLKLIGKIYREGSLDIRLF
jgi:hypothetical protein